MFPSDYFAPDYFAPSYWPRGFAPPMPDIVEALVAHLRADATLATLLDTRIRAAWLAEGDAMPALTITVVSTDPLADLGGNLGTDATLVQIDVWADDMGDAVAIARRVRFILDGYSGTMAGLPVGSARRLDESRSLAWPGDGKGRPLSRITADYRIRHASPIALRFA